MSDEFQLTSNGNWWDSPRTSIFTASSTSSAVTQIAATSGSSYGWSPPELSTNNFKTRSMESSSDPNLHMIGLGLSWNQNLLNGGGKSENTSNTSFRSLLQLEDDINHDDEFKQSNLGFTFDHHHHHHQQQQHMMDSVAYGNPSFILQGPSLMSHNHQQEIYYGMNSPNGLFPSWNPKYSTHQQEQHQQFSGNVSFWNNETQTNIFPPSPSPSPSFTQSSISIEQKKPKNAVKIGETTESSVGKKGTTETSNKRQRSNETLPSPATFKVKKEKMGDRITALQQLVSPFGKTDTASVLSEAIEYIKFLHEQVSVLSNPYMKNGAPNSNSMQQYKIVHDNTRDSEEAKQDLRSRGLCLVPVMSTFAVTHDTTTVEFWNPTFGGSFR